MAPVKLRLGQLVETSEGRQGVIRYIGSIHVARGEWCGLELADDAGKNDGSIQNQVYFVCNPDHGIFVKKESIIRVLEESRAVTGPDSTQSAVGPSSMAAVKTRPSSGMSSQKRQSVVSGSNSTRPTGSRASTASPVKFPARTSRASVSSSTASTPRTTPTTMARISQVSARPRLSVAETMQTMAPPARKSLAISTTRPDLMSAASSSSTPTPARPVSSLATRNGTTTASWRMDSRAYKDQAVLEPDLQKEPDDEEEQSEAETAEVEQSADGSFHPTIAATTRDVSPRPSARSTSKGEPPPPTNGTGVVRQASMSKPDTAYSESITTLQREIESLKVKLRTMENKRREDREKIKQIDTQQSRIDQLETIIRTMETKLKQSNEEKRAAQARYEEAHRPPAAEPDLSAQFESELELATLDKEMAEEKAEVLQLELDELKEKHTELSNEVAVLRQENKELTSGLSAEERASAGWLHLERERDRLKEALLALRDQKISVETELKEEIAHLEKEFAEAEETAGKYIEAAEALQKLEDIHAELKEELEAIDNQDDIVSSMVEERDRHLQVIERLRVQNSELEELAQTNADLEALYLDNERSLQSRIDEQEAYLSEREREKTEQDRTIEDLELTLSKFRDVVQGLRTEIDEARRSREISEVQALEMKARSETMREFNMRLQSSAVKSQAKWIDTELMRANAASAQKHVKILSVFLTDTLDDERNPVQAYLAFGQLKLKAKLVREVLLDRLRDREHGHTNEEVLRAYEIAQYMSWIQCSADRFETFISTCSSAEFLAYSNVMSDIDPVLRAVEGWLEALRADEYSPDGPEHVKRMQGIVLDLGEKLIPASTESCMSAICSHANTIEFYLDVVSSMLNWVMSYTQRRLGGRNDENSRSTEFDRIFEQLTTKSRTAKYQMGKLNAELAKTRSRHRCLGEEDLSLFSTAEKAAADVCTKARQAARGILSQLDEDSAAVPSYHQLLQTTVGADEAEDISALLGRVQSDVSELQSKVELLSARVIDAGTMVEFVPKEAPWLIRSRELKARRVNALQLQDDLVRAQRLNAEHVARVAEREQTIEDLNMRVELAERRVKDTRARDQSDQAFRDEIERLTMVKTELEAQLTQLQISHDNLEIIANRDRHDLEVLQTATSTSARDTAKASLHGSLDPSLATQFTAHIRMLDAKILLLNSTVRHLQAEAYSLSVPVSEVQLQVAREAWLDADILTAHERAIRSRNQTARAQLTVEHNNVLMNLIEMTNHLQPARLSSRRQAQSIWHGHVPTRETTRYQVARQREEFEQWHSWQAEVRRKIELGSRAGGWQTSSSTKRSKAVSGGAVPALRLDGFIPSKVEMVSGEVNILTS